MSYPDIGPRATIPSSRKEVFVSSISREDISQSYIRRNSELALAEDPRASVSRGQLAAASETLGRELAYSGVDLVPGEEGCHLRAERRGELEAVAAGAGVDE